MLLKDLPHIMQAKASSKDITGERFGRLLVIGRTHNIGKDTAWLCKCDCGNYKSVRTSGLKTGDYVSCGCKRAEINSPHDITGEKFGRLTAIELTDRRSPSGDAYWKCECECGNVTEVRKSKLTGGYSKSCGCINRELTSARQSKSGYDLTGKRFGRLKVIKPIGKREGQGRVWLCECDCGNVIETVASSLVRGRAISCGCKTVEHVTQLGLSNKGKNNPAYNHELTDEQRNAAMFQRTSDEAKKARRRAYKRDGYKCNICGKGSRNLNAHHLDSFADNEDKRFDFNNLVTLCKKCHIGFHKTYGYGNNTKEQFEEFKDKTATGCPYAADKQQELATKHRVDIIQSIKIIKRK